MSTEARQDSTTEEAEPQGTGSATTEQELESRAEVMRLIGEALDEGSCSDALGELIERIVAREVEASLATLAGVPHVLGAVEEIMAAVPFIGKGGTTPEKAGGYRFRGIDAVMHELAPAFRAARCGLQSQVISYEFHTEGKMTDARVHMRYLVTSLVDGSTFECSGMGEGRDSSDKGANKAMSLAKKEALCSAFMIATDEYDMAEAESPEYEDRPAARSQGTSRPRGQDAPRQDAPRRYSPEEYARSIDGVTDYPTLRRIGDHIADAGMMDEVVDGSSLRHRLQGAAATFSRGNEGGTR